MIRGTLTLAAFAGWLTATGAFGASLCRVEAFAPGPVFKAIMARLPAAGVAALPPTVIDGGVPVGRTTLVRGGSVIGEIIYAANAREGTAALVVNDAAGKRLMEVREDRQVCLPPFSPAGLCRELTAATALQPPITPPPPPGAPGTPPPVASNPGTPQPGPAVPGTLPPGPAVPGTPPAPPPTIPVLAPGTRMPWELMLGPDDDELAAYTRYATPVDFYTYSHSFLEALDWLNATLHQTLVGTPPQATTPEQRAYWALASDPLVAPYLPRLTFWYGWDKGAVRLVVHGVAPSNEIYGLIIDDLAAAGFPFADPDMIIDTRTALPVDTDPILLNCYGL